MMKNDNRLTFYRSDGTFGVCGMTEDNMWDKTYACILKLKDYEDRGLSPEEIDDIKYVIEDLIDDAAALEEWIRSNQSDHISTTVGRMLERIKYLGTTMKLKEG